VKRAVKMLDFCTMQVPGFYEIRAEYLTAVLVFEL